MSGGGLEFGILGMIGLLRGFLFAMWKKRPRVKRSSNSISCMRERRPRGSWNGFWAGEEDHVRDASNCGMKLRIGVRLNRPHPKILSQYLTMYRFCILELQPISGG